MMLMRDPRKYDATRGTLGGFLYGVTRNRVLKHLERLPREVPLEEQHDNGTGLGIVLRGASTPAMQAEEHERVERDRKSTRLNSSHGYISYAVFCLKKKKNQRHTDLDGPHSHRAPRIYTVNACDPLAVVVSSHRKHHRPPKHRNHRQTAVRPRLVYL